MNFFMQKMLNKYYTSKRFEIQVNQLENKVERPGTSKSIIFKMFNIGV